jgi:Ca-activated chloride channel family protein
MERAQLKIADQVDTEDSLLAGLRKKVSLPIQFLAIDSPDSSQRETVRQAASTLRASVVPIDVEGDDVAAIVRVAGRTPVGQHGEAGGQWQEAGYWLVPLIGVLVLASFRREYTEEDGK